MRKTLNRRSSQFALLVLAILLAWTVISMPYKNSPAIRSDGVGYHIWVAAFKSLDFNFCRYKALLDPTLSISVVNQEQSRCGIKYPPGVALLQFPFTAYWVSADVSNGFSPVQHLAVLLIAAFLLLFWSVFSYKSLELLGCPNYLRLIAVAGFLFGSGLFHYGTYDGSLSHVYSAFGVSALLWIVIKSGRSGWTLIFLAAFTALSFWLYLVRPTNVLITFAVLVFSWTGSSTRTRLTVSLLWGVATAVAALLILGYNYYMTGHLIFSSYGTEKFIALGSHVYEVLLSYTRGFALYQPVFIFTAVLAICLSRNVLSALFIVLLIIFTVLYSSWHSWTLGSGFGHRGFVELSSLGVLVLGISLSRLRRYALTLTLSGIIGCCYVTLAIMTSYWQGNYPLSDASSTDYFQSVFPWLRFERFKLAYSQDDFREISLALVQKTRTEEGVVVELSIKNNSLRTFYAGSSVYHPVRIGWRFVNGQGKPSTSWDEKRQDIPADLRANDDLSVSITVDPKMAIKGGFLQVSVVQESKFWLHDIGAKPLEIPWD